MTKSYQSSSFFVYKNYLFLHLESTYEGTYEGSFQKLPMKVASTLDVPTDGRLSFVGWKSFLKLQDLHVGQAVLIIAGTTGRNVQMMSVIDIINESMPPESSSLSEFLLEAGSEAK